MDSTAQKIEAVLIHGTDAERESLLRVIEKLRPEEHLRVYCWAAANRDTSGVSPANSSGSIPLIPDAPKRAVTHP